jgi:hypothetical protein
MFHPFSDVIPRRVENILKLWADSWNLHSNNNLNGIQSIVGKNSWSYGMTSKENIAVRLCRIDHAMMVHNYTSASPEEGYTVLPLFVRPSVRLRLFSSHFSQQLLMAEIWYLVTSFILVCNIVGSVFGPVSFLLPVCRLSWFLCTLNIYAGLS